MVVEIVSVQNKIKKYCKDKKIKEKYRKRNKVIKQINAYKELGKEDTIYQIINNLTSRMCTKLKKNNIEREITYSQFLGCTPQFLKSFIENKFKEGMSYNNYGEWEVDHIHPISKIDFDKPEQIKKCFHHTNLQPLWRSENIKKSNKI